MCRKVTGTHLKQNEPIYQDRDSNFSLKTNSFNQSLDDNPDYSRDDYPNFSQDDDFNYLRDDYPNCSQDDNPDFIGYEHIL